MILKIHTHIDSADTSIGKEAGYDTWRTSYKIIFRKPL